MDSVDSITDLIAAIRSGDKEALHRAAPSAWKRYFDRLKRLIEQKLNGKRFVFNGEDVALSALDSLLRHEDQPKFPELAGKDSLWFLLVKIAERKLAERVRSEHRQKRDVDQVAGGISALTNKELKTPPEAEMIATDMLDSLESLGEDKLREITVLLLEGHTQQEVAEKLGVSLRTIVRKLERIRKYLRTQLDKESGL